MIASTEAVGKLTGVPALCMITRLTDPNQIAVGMTIVGLQGPCGLHED